MVAEGDRDAALSIGQDIAAVVNVFAKVKRTPGATVGEAALGTQLESKRRSYR